MNAVILDRLIRIGIADDNELVRETLRLMLDCSPNLQVWVKPIMVLKLLQWSRLSNQMWFSWTLACLS